MLKLEKVTKFYGTKRMLFCGISDINLCVNEGEAIAIVGASGTGKSTLLNVMSTIDSPTEGDIWLDDINLTRLSNNKKSKIRLNKFGFVFQKFNLISGLNVYDNICMPSVFSVKKTDYEWIGEIIENLGLTDIQKKLPATISGGEQQRAAIARALVNRPQIIFADEPTGNLDSENSFNVAKLLFTQGKRNGCSLVLVTHDMDIAGMADRIIEIKDGRFC